MRIGTSPDPGLNKKRLSWVQKQLAKRELRDLSKEIESIRELLSVKYNETQEFQSPAVRMLSSHLDSLIVRYQRLVAQVNEDTEN